MSLTVVLYIYIIYMYIYTIKKLHKLYSAFSKGLHGGALCKPYYTTTPVGQWTLIVAFEIYNIFCTIYLYTIIYN